MKLFYFLLLFFSFSGWTSPIYAQQFLGDISIARQQMTLLQNDTLRLELGFLIRNRAVNTCQRWILVPELSTSDKSHEHFFPRIVVNGKNKQRMEERREYLTHRYWSEAPAYQVVNVAKEEQTLVDYVVEVPYEAWMGDASLKLQQVLISCGNRRQLISVPLAGGIIYPYRQPYDPQIVAAYLEPASGHKQRAVKGEAYLDFQAGRSAILPTFRNNSEELGKIRAIIDQIRRDGDMTITDIFIEGYASPEGNSELNARLSLARAEALKNYLHETYRFADNFFQVSSVGEDWAGLRMLVDQSNLPAREKILEVIGSDRTADQKERSLKNMGSIWKTLLTTIFPQLRHVDYQIKYNLKNYDLSESRLLAERAPEKLSLSELYNVARSYTSDSVRHYRTFDLIQQLYPQDPVANINVAASLLQRGNSEAARRCLEIASGAIQDMDRTAAAVFANNMGALLLKENRLDEAERLLQRAADAGQSEARVNEAELKKKRADNLQLERYKQLSQ